MNNSQQQSLDDNAVFSPVLESSADFLHCEAERCALEQLLNTGPGPFYTKLNKERLTHFLSPEEVNQVSGWAEDYHISEVHLDKDFGDDSGSDTQDYSVQYFPAHTDVPAPCLDLGWPEKAKWEGVDQAMVYTNPPMEQMPHIREVVRRLLQGANMLIAIVMDLVTDSAVIADLHCAASRGVPVYIILNRRSVQENFTQNRFRHPNIRVRTVGGKTFMSRSGKMVVGELKENFILVDLQTVVLGNYSLTWTDAHLHRQLITIISGPMVESFDREFRILYAASLPVPVLWKSSSHVVAPIADEAPTLYQPKYLHSYNHNSELRERPSSPPPPPTDCPLDWEAMGVIQWNQGISAGLDSLPGVCEEPLQTAGLNGQPWVSEARRVPGVEEFGTTEGQAEDKLYPSVNAEPRRTTDHLTMFGLTGKPEWFSRRRLSLALDTERESWDSMFSPREQRIDMSLKNEPGTFSHTHRRDYLRGVDRSVGGNAIPEETPPEPNAAATDHKKPLILSVPQTESFSSLSDILKRINTRKSGKEQQKRAAKTTISKSMLDLSAPVPDKQQMPSFYDNFPLTPALALIKKRNDEIKSGLSRVPRTFTPLPRTRSSSFSLQREPWRSMLHREQRNGEDN